MCVFIKHQSAALCCLLTEHLSSACAAGCSVAMAAAATTGSKNGGGGGGSRSTPLVVKPPVVDVVSALLSGDPALVTHNITKLNTDDALRAAVLGTLRSSFVDGAREGRFAGKRSQMALMVQAYVATKALPTELGAWSTCVLLSDSRTRGLWGEAPAFLLAFRSLLENFLSHTPFPLNLQVSGYLLNALAAACQGDEAFATAMLDSGIDGGGVLGNTVRACVFSSMPFPKFAHTTQQVLTPPAHAVFGLGGRRVVCVAVCRWRFG